MILKKDQVTILIKGSRNAKMETIVEYLIREFKKNADLA
jgi:UDP-N-acetylmuramoyl-tripeptide--D-alanyl-D-alanine ligase